MSVQIKSRVFTMKDWKGSFQTDINKPEFYDWDSKTVEITEEVYDSFLCSLPPISIWKGFMNSEPVSHNNKGQATYAAFQCVGNRYYYIGLQTMETAKLLC